MHTPALQRPRPASSLFLRGLQLGAAFVALTLALPTAQAVRVRAVVQPLRCAEPGVCFTANNADSLTGAYREGNQELQFEAIALPWTPPADDPAPWAYSPWCARLTEPNGEVYTSFYGNQRCVDLWFPNYREQITEEELSAEVERFQTTGLIVFGAQRAAAVANVPAGSEQAWLQVQNLMEHLADSVRFHTGH